MACCGQLVLPSKLQASAIRDLHEGAVGGHLGKEVLSHLKERSYWPGCAEAVRNWYNSCLTCATRRIYYPQIDGISAVHSEQVSHADGEY